MPPVPGATTSVTPLRFLLTCQPGSGHVNPMLPLGSALRAAGHDVAVATASSYAAVVERHGLEHVRAGLEWDEARLEETVPAIRAVPRTDRPFWMLEELFLDRAARAMVADLQEVCGTWRPDVVVVSKYEFGGVLVAEALGLPYAMCDISFRWRRPLVKRICSASIERLRADLGLSPDPACLAYGRYLDLCLMPETWTFEQGMAERWYGRFLTARLRSPQRGLALKMHAVRAAIGIEERRRRRRPPDVPELFVSPAEAPLAAAEPPACLHGLPDQPTVYVTLGTVFNDQFPEVFDAVVAGLRDEPVNLVLTLGADGDPGRFGPQPPNVRIERFVPQAELLPHVDLCVNHGGFGSTVAPMRHGLPQVILPLSADQPLIAMLGLSHGVAAVPAMEAFELAGGQLNVPVVDPRRLTPDVIRGAVRAALASAELRAGARAMQTRLEAMPGLDVAVAALERLAPRAAA